MDQEQAALAELSQGTEATQEQTPAETAYLEALHEGKSTRLPLNAEFVINENGQIQRIPANKLINGYRQVSHIQREQKKFKDERSAWEKENEGYQELSKHYKEIDSWARQNPDQWQRLQEMYGKKEQFLSNPTSVDPQAGMFDHLTKTIKGLEERLGKYENMYQQTEQQKVVSEVDNEINTFKKDFPQINLDEQDADGISLKSQILKFGADHGYPTFEAAALGFKTEDGTPLRTKLLDTAKLEGRNAAVKGVKQDHKDGVIARSDKPFSGQNPFDVTRFNKGDRDEAAARELTELLKKHG